MQICRVFFAMAMLSFPLEVNSASWGYRHHQASRHRYTIEGTKAAMDAALQTPHSHLDIRSIKATLSSEQPVHADTKVRADVVGSEKNVEAFAAAGTLHSTAQTIHLSKHVRGRISKTLSPMKGLKHEGYSEAQVIAKDRGETLACIEGTKGYLDDLQEKTGNESSDRILYTKNPFFDCFRPSHEVFDFLDVVTEQNPEFITKYENVSITYEGRAIPAFKISTTSKREEVITHKKTLYTQALIHAREWQAGAATLYTMASMLDDLRAGDEAAISLFDKFDWYFVPIVNIDGYQYTWEVDRMWRTNRHLVNWNGQDVGVDLNRNWPPEEYFKLDPSNVDQETYPGEHPLSEASTARLFDFIKNLDSLSGVLDMHTFGGQVLRPFSNQPGSGAEPFGSRMRALGDSVRNALSTKPNVQYQSETGANLYKAYGCFDDGIFLEFNLTVPALTIEVEGGDFVSPQNSIRPVGENIHLGLRQFAHEALEYTQQQEVEADVRKEDQLHINEFGRNNALLHEIRDQKKVVKDKLDTLDDANTDLMMGEDDNIQLFIGESFVEASEESAQEYIEKQMEEANTELMKLQAEESKLEARQSTLKTLLYSRFGQSINLEDS
ncbi:unnamed protein product [Peronospora destructor]|uniref:Peptidase M14 domain-containing protein n=1 Tax=Peronospora destructor TaxID=86335 RepID=A0AAV0V2L0_9STRA|nr:unnamed protein product [Peronospora destructor]